MEVDINWLAVVAAALTSMLIGGVWYSKKGFLKLWLSLMKMDEKKFEKGAKRAPLITLLVTLVTAYVLGYFIFIAHTFFGNSYLQDALMTALWAWLGFTAARFVMHSTFEQKPEKLMLLNCGFELVSLLAMALIFALMHTS